MRLDDLVFGERERGTSDDLALQFDTISQLSEARRQNVRELVEGKILEHVAWRRDMALAERAEAAQPKNATAGTKPGRPVA